jgi:hypothetical protein
MSHTPGPWEPLTDRHCELLIFAPSAEEFVCGVTVFLPDAEANARLIAAAPDLLVSLKEMLEVWEEDPAYGAMHAEKARAAIAKAEGANEL